MLSNPFYLKPSFYVKSVTIIALSLFISCASVPVDARPPKPGPNYVWVPVHKSKNGAVIPGHWRLKHRKGFTWVKGDYNRHGEWVPGHWKPVGPAPKGKIWIPGHVNKRGVWVDGYWKPVRRR